jgi:arsenate reductase
MEKLTVYQKPTCSKCRETLAILREAKATFDSVDYFAAPMSVATLRRLVKKLGVSPREIMRTGEEIYKRLEQNTKELSDDEIIKIMVIYPDLIQRPIIEKGDKAVLGRPPENVKDLL